MYYYGKLSEIRSGVCFGVVSDLSAKILLENAFVSRYVKTIDQKVWIVRLTGSRTTPKITTSNN